MLMTRAGCLVCPLIRWSWLVDPARCLALVDVCVGRSEGVVNSNNSAGGVLGMCIVHVHAPCHSHGQTAAKIDQNRAVMAFPPAKDK